MAEEVLHAQIRAEATGGETIERVRREVAALETNLHALGREERHGTGILGRFAEGVAFMGERTEGVRDHLMEFRAATGETGATIGELVPMLGALGAAASVTGLVEMTRETAEAHTQLSAMATTLGMSVANLQAFRLAAAETDVPVEAMQTGMMRLARSVADAAGGRNKQAAEIFGRMGIQLRDGNGHLKTAAELIPLIGESLRRTTDVTLRSAVAMQLFGRSGAELIPMLVEGKGGLEELQRASQRLNATYSSKDNENVEKFKNSWIELDTAVGGLKDTITADLAPVMTPIIHDMTDWIAANREWIGQDIKSDFLAVRDALKNVDWHTVGTDIKTIADDLNIGADAVGGWVRIGEVLAGLVALKFAWGLAQPLIELTAIGIKTAVLTKDLAALALGWGKVGEAAAGAAAAEKIAASVKPSGISAVADEGKNLAAHAPAIEDARDASSRFARIAKTLPLVATGVEFLYDAPPLMNYAAHLDGSVDQAARAGSARHATGAGHDQTHASSEARGRNAARGTGGPHGADPFEEVGHAVAAMYGWISELHDRSYAAPSSRDGEVKVTVQLQGAPPGTTATVEQSGAVRAEPVDVGHNHPMGYPTR